MTTAIVIFALLAFAVSARQSSYVFLPDHESDTWRHDAGRPAASLSKAMVFTRNDRVGIGNALGILNMRPPAAFILLMHLIRGFR